MAATHGRDRRRAGPLVAATAPDLITSNGVGTDPAGALIVAVGDNPERLGNEVTFAHVCGVSSLDASSGKQLRHRLNRDGNRQANSALWPIVFIRMAPDPRTQRYVERRCKEGLTRRRRCGVSGATSPEKPSTTWSR
jgi:transposase